MADDENELEFGFRCSSEFKERLQRIAKRKGMSASALIRSTMIDFCDAFDKNQKAKKVSGIERAKSNRRIPRAKPSGGASSGHGTVAL